MPRIKNYVAKKIYARVVGFGLNKNYAHIMVPSQWINEEVTLIEYKNGSTQVKKLKSIVKNYNKITGHIPLSPMFMGDVFEVTLDDHEKVISRTFTEQSSSSSTVV